MNAPDVPQPDSPPPSGPAAARPSPPISRPEPQAMEHVWIDSGPDRLAASIDLPLDLPPDPDLPDRSNKSAPWPWVMLIHGFTGHRVGRSYHFVQFGRTLAQNGVACIRFDQAGCGESTGDQMHYGLETIRRDVRAVHAWIEADGRFDVERMGVLGSSQGAIGALMADAEFPTGAIALWAPVFDLPLLVKGKLKDVEAIGAIQTLGYAPYRGIRLGPAYFKQLRLVDAADLVGQSNSPVLAFHAEDDEVVLIEHSEMLQAACQANGRSCEMVRMPGKSHDFAEEPERHQVIPQTAKWLAAHLQG